MRPGNPNLVADLKRKKNKKESRRQQFLLRVQPLGPKRWSESCRQHEHLQRQSDETDEFIRPVTRLSARAVKGAKMAQATKMIHTPDPSHNENDIDNMCPSRNDSGISANTSDNDEIDHDGYISGNIGGETNTMTISSPTNLAKVIEHTDNSPNLTDDDLNNIVINIDSLVHETTRSNCSSDVMLKQENEKKNVEKKIEKNTVDNLVQNSNLPIVQPPQLPLFTLPLTDFGSNVNDIHDYTNTNEDNINNDTTNSTATTQSILLDSDLSHNDQTNLNTINFDSNKANNIIGSDKLVKNQEDVEYFLGMDHSTQPVPSPLQPISHFNTSNTNDDTLNNPKEYQKQQQTQAEDAQLLHFINPPQHTHNEQYQQENSSTTSYNLIQDSNYDIIDVIPDFISIPLSGEGTNITSSTTTGNFLYDSTTTTPHQHSNSEYLHNYSPNFNNQLAGDDINGLNGVIPLYDSHTQTLINNDINTMMSSEQLYEQSFFQDIARW